MSFGWDLLHSTNPKWCRWPGQGLTVHSIALGAMISSGIGTPGGPWEWTLGLLLVWPVKRNSIFWEHNSSKDDASLYLLRTTTWIPRIKPTQRKREPRGGARLDSLCIVEAPGSSRSWIYPPWTLEIHKTSPLFALLSWLLVNWGWVALMYLEASDKAEEQW